MSVFVDTGLFYAVQNRRARHHAEARRALADLATGRLGTLFTSSFVYDETVTLTLKRTRRFEEAKTAGDRILGRGGFPRAFVLLHVDAARFRAAVEVFERYPDQGLSFTDATTVALMEERGIDRVASFDDGFDGVVARADPVRLATEDGIDGEGG